MLHNDVSRLLRFAIAVLLVMGLSLALGPVRSYAQEADLRAGVARMEITPTAPVTLAGYASRKDLSKGVHDPLSARVIVFEQKGQRLVLINTDLIGFYDGSLDAVRKPILETCGLQEGQLFLTAIHTHSGPSTVSDEAKGHKNNVEYTRALGGKLAALVKEAIDHLAPVQLGFGSGWSPVGVNRRESVTNPAGKTEVRLGRNPYGLTDREVQVLVLRRPGAEKPAAVLFDYATHSTCLGPGNYLISGDVHGLAAQFVEKNLGPDVIAPAFAGASGDIDPWFRVLPGFETDNGWVPEPVLLGTMLGEEVVQTARKVKVDAAKGPIASQIRTIDLPTKATSDEGAVTKSTKPFTITVGRVGDVAFVGLGGEVFNAIGKGIKTKSPFPKTIVMTHCNGTAGYLPTADSYEAGGYEVHSSAFAPGGGEKVLEEAVRMLKQMANAE